MNSFRKNGCHEMQVTFKMGDIVKEDVDGLVCSGNIWLNMSGGINGELLRLGGEAMQRQLHDYLATVGKRHVDPGFAIRVGPEPFRFKSIVYTVAVDAFYDSSVELACSSLKNALSVLAEDGCNTVAVPALATGYGHLAKRDFGKALRLCLAQDSWPFKEIRVVVSSDSDVEEVRSGYESA